ncbi:melanophilin isoform X1 [Anolis carolinensis]|uniref:Melanophilin n=1 Tax=Anolis carolinensis TaxID=28377 RepID=G1KCW1_ANOCA|nr:PREDICTED: melanophilin isoform X1 [Anolis carolinensis]|eukprot:XP_008112807.1 PREDICTED: melanophilin isoform X1 [Anolis carolinensis]
MGRKLDLSKLTDEEAKHVWEVIQRDINLRKKEEERLEDLKGKLEKESTKRELLSAQSHLNETHCIHCLQPFKFLVNSKRQCLDCHLHTCKSCSSFNKKEQGWVCDPCRLSRVVKTGSLEWYYEHVRSRFKRFGSAKVMRSLYGRMAPSGQKTKPSSLGLRDRVYSLPDINNDCHLYNEEEEDSGADEANDVLDSAEAERCARMRRTKRLLSVHPFDFELDSEYSAQSRRQSVQLSPGSGNEGLETFEEFPGAEEEATQKESMVAEADLASMFHHILQEQGQKTSAPEQEFTTEVRFTVNSHTKNLERTSKAGNPWNEQQPSQYSGDMDTSDEDVKGAHKSLAYPPHHTKRRSRASSQENLNHSGSQILDLNKRMSAIERMLNRLEEKILVHSEEPEGSDSHTDPSVEEKELKRKLEQLARNISDKGISSDEDEEEKKTEQHKQVMSSSSDDQPTGTKKVYFLPEKTYELEKKLRALDHTRHSITTDSELSELEDKVASAMADVQHTESEVSDIETRIAALSAAGLTVKPVEKSKKKSSSQVFTLQPTRNSYNSPDDQSSDSPVTASSDDFKVMAMPHVLRRKFTSSLEISNNAESFARNSYYRGSLTQRNPNGRNRKADRIFSKPVMTHRS